MATARQRRHLAAKGKTAVGAKQLPWREDPVVRRRLGIVSTLMLGHATAFQMLDIVNTKMAEAGEEPVSESTLRRDRDRVRELWAEEADFDIKRVQAQLIAELDDKIRKAMVAFEELANVPGGKRSQNRSAFLNTAVTAIKEKARIYGFGRPGIEINNSVHVDGIDVVIAGMEKLIPDEAEFVGMLEEFRGGQSGGAAGSTRHVVDAPAGDA